VKVKIPSLFAIVAVAALLIGISGGLPVGAQEDIVIPASTLDQTSASGHQIAVLAGGCFWGVQGVFQHVQGVENAVSGYAGGSASHANYHAVVSGRTAHAEAVQVTFDPSVISYGEILQIYFSVAHDPTQFNRQGPDRGSEYRSAIFPQNAEQARIASAYIDQLNAARIYRAAIVTTIETDKPFYPAEDYHQDYMTKYPNQPYILINDLPKVESLKRLFPHRFRETPQRVAQTGT